MHTTHAFERAHVGDAMLTRERAIHAEAQLAQPNLPFVGANRSQDLLEISRGVERADDATALDLQRDRCWGNVKSKRNVGEGVDLHAPVYSFELAASLKTSPMGNKLPTFL